MDPVIPDLGVDIYDMIDAFGNKYGTALCLIVGFGCAFYLVRMVYFYWLEVTGISISDIYHRRY